MLGTPHTRAQHTHMRTPHSRRRDISLSEVNVFFFKAFLVPVQKNESIIVQSSFASAAAA